MTISFALCSNVGVSLLDLPRIESIHDPHAALEAAVGWHCGGPDTGSRFWVTRAKSPGFDPLTDVKASEDLLDAPVSEPPVTNMCSGHHPSTFRRPRSAHPPLRQHCGRREPRDAQWLSLDEALVHCTEGLGSGTE